jgi:hypothetical protein
MDYRQASAVVAVVAVLLALLVAKPATAQDQDQPPRLPRNVAALAAEAELTTEQKSQLAALAIQRAEAIGQWHQANDQKLDEHKQAIAAARAANRHQERAEAVRERAALLAEIREIEAGYDAQLPRRRGGYMPGTGLAWRIQVRLERSEGTRHCRGWPHVSQAFMS